VRSPSGRVVASLRKDPDIYANSSHNLSELDISNEVKRYQQQQAPQPLDANLYCKCFYRKKHYALLKLFMLDWIQNDLN
jgi:hypothetical protein